MLLLLLKLSLFVQTDSLDLIYDNFYQNQNNYKEQISLVTDKDYYFSGEKVHYFIQISALNHVDSIKSKWGQVFLFNDARKVVSYARFYLKNGKAIGSLIIPDSVSSSRVYLSLATVFAQKSPFKYLTVWSNMKNDKEYVENKVSVITKNKHLIPNQPNLLYIKSNYLTEENAAIVDQNNKPIVQFLLKGNRTLAFSPSINQKYFLSVNTQKIELTIAKHSVDIKAYLLDNKIRVSTTNLDAKTNDNILMVCAGKEILWLSNLTSGEIEIPIEDFQYSYIFCLVLDKNLNMIDREILAYKNLNEKIEYERKNDTLILNIPAQFRKLPLFVKAVESDYQLNKLIFTTKELNELSFYGAVPKTIYFSNNLEKINWLNYSFKVNVEALTQAAKPTKKVELSKIIYHLPSNVKIDDKLKVNAIDYKNRIINFKLLGHKIFINPNEFENEESLLMLSAYYKKSKLKLVKDSTEVLKNIENKINKFFSDENYLQSEENIFSLEYAHQLHKLKNTVILKEVAIVDNKYKVNYRGKGLTKTYQELKLSKYTPSALNLFPQIGVHSLPDWNGYIISKRPYSSLVSHYKIAYYNMFLVISGPSGVQYSGYDFRKLFPYDASWVVSITKKDSYPEGVIVFIKPGFRGVNSLISYEKIFAQATLNDNSGVAFWNFDSNGDNEQIKIPLGTIDGSVSWTLQFFEPNGTILEYKGIYEHSDER